ncbi:hypothetical protein pipiens_013250 [Culex pipiens pipiens]|uniref:Chitin-binding type-2 domain-containing protein n=1 Tax=Culex pipiens pipiens TaxID=38569 RepID=A0ABD1CVA1_CULPP
MKVFLLVVTTLVVAINAQSESKQFMPPVPSPSMPLPPIPSPSMPLPPIPSPSLPPVPVPSPSWPPVPVPSPSMPPQPSPGTGGGGNGGNINNCPLDSRCPAVNPVTPVLLPNGVCTRFLKCHNGRACQYDCPPGLHFNREKLVCDWPEQACCDPSVPCRPADNGNATNLDSKATIPISIAIRSNSAATNLDPKATIAIPNPTTDPLAVRAPATDLEPISVRSDSTAARWRSVGIGDGDATR